MADEAKDPVSAGSTPPAGEPGPAPSGDSVAPASVPDASSQPQIDEDAAAALAAQIAKDEAAEAEIARKTQESLAAAAAPVAIGWVSIYDAVRHTGLPVDRIRELVDIGSVPTSMQSGFECIRPEDLPKLMELHRQNPEPAPKPVSAETAKATLTVPDVVVVPAPPAPPTPAASSAEPKPADAWRECEFTARLEKGEPVLRAICSCGKHNPVQQVIVMPRKEEEREFVTAPPAHDMGHSDDPPRKHGLPWWAWVIIVGIAIPAISWVFTKLMDKAAEKAASAVVDSDTTSVKNTDESDKNTKAIAVLTTEVSDHENRIKDLEARPEPVPVPAATPSPAPAVIETLAPAPAPQTAATNEVMEKFLKLLRMAQSHARNGASGSVDIVGRKIRSMPDFPKLQSMGHKALMVRIAEELGGDAIDPAFADAILSRQLGIK